MLGKIRINIKIYSIHGEVILKYPVLYSLLTDRMFFRFNII